MVLLLVGLLGGPHYCFAQLVLTSFSCPKDTSPVWNQAVDAPCHHIALLELDHYLQLRVGHTDRHLNDLRGEEVREQLAELRNRGTWDERWRRFALVVERLWASVSLTEPNVCNRMKTEIRSGDPCMVLMQSPGWPERHSIVAFGYETRGRTTLFAVGDSNAPDAQHHRRQRPARYLEYDHEAQKWNYAYEPFKGRNLAYVDYVSLKQFPDYVAPRQREPAEATPYPSSPC
jgi:hypothetical protein